MRTINQKIPPIAAGIISDRIIFVDNLARIITLNPQT
jgi:hypothetical protein